MSINISEYNTISEILKALSHPYRICIVRGLINKKCNVNTMQECLGISQSNVSQHLAKLKSAGIIQGKRSGNQIYYEVINQTAINIINAAFED